MDRARKDAPPLGAVGVLAALAEELAPLASRASAHAVRHGLAVGCQDLGAPHAGLRLLSAVCGVGKVNAARGACALLDLGAELVLVVGTCGGLCSYLGPGELIHCREAVQADLALRPRSWEADARVLGAWSRLVPGHTGVLLTADRPVLSPWRRLRLQRHFRGACGADMETAAAAAVASAAGRPWAALRAVTDRAGFLGGRDFRRHFSRQAARAADSVPALLAVLAGPDSGGEVPRR